MVDEQQEQEDDEVVCTHDTCIAQHQFLQVVVVLHGRLHGEPCSSSIMKE